MHVVLLLPNVISATILVCTAHRKPLIKYHFFSESSVRKSHQCIYFGRCLNPRMRSHYILPCRPQNTGIPRTINSWHALRTLKAMPLLAILILAPINWKRSDYRLLPLSFSTYVHNVWWTKKRRQSLPTAQQYYLDKIKTIYFENPQKRYVIDRLFSSACQIQ